VVKGFEVLESPDPRQLDLRLGMILELAARRRWNQVHVTPVYPGVDCGSKARTSLL
jgi:hypothetical protein